MNYMKIETMKIRSKSSKKYGINVLVSKGNLYIELGLGKLVFMIGILK